MTNEESRAGAPGRRTPTILIVEDEADLAETCVRFLRQLGYRAWVARTGPEALEAIRTNPPDLVIADVRLPGAMDGFGVVRHVRQREPRIPVIVWTAHGSERTRQESLDAGAVGYLPKPFSLAELRALVDRIVGQGRGPDGDATGSR